MWRDRRETAHGLFPISVAKAPKSVQAEENTDVFQLFGHM